MSTPNVSLGVVLSVALAACGARTGLRTSAEAAPDAAAPDAIAPDAAPDAIAIDAAPDAPIEPACASGLVQIATTAASPDQIALDDAFVYWHDETGVFRAPKSGGAPQPLAQAPSLGWPQLATFALSATDAFVTIGPTMVASVPKTGGPLQPLPMPIVNFPALATSPSRVFGWGSGSSSPLFAAPLGGGPVTIVATLPSATEKIVIEGGRAFTASDGGVQSVSLGSPGAVTYLSGLAASDLALDGSTVWFTTSDLTNGAAIQAVPKNGGPTSLVLKRNGVYAIAVSASDLYFTDRLNMIVAKIVGKTSSNLVTLASFDFTTQPVDLVLDDACVYVTISPAGAPGSIVAFPR